MKIKRCTMIALVLLMIISNVYAEPTATPIPTTDPTATTDPIVTSDPTITLNPTATSDPTITSDPSASPDTTETPKHKGIYCGCVFGYKRMSVSRNIRNAVRCINNAKV